MVWGKRPTFTRPGGATVLRNRRLASAPIPDLGAGGVVPARADTNAGLLTGPSSSTNKLTLLIFYRSSVGCYKPCQ